MIQKMYVDDYFFLVDTFLVYFKGTRTSLKHDKSLNKVQNIPLFKSFLNNFPLPPIIISQTLRPQVSKRIQKLLNFMTQHKLIYLRIVVRINLA